MEKIIKLTLVKTFNVWQFPIGFISDIHNNIESVKKVLIKHPEVKQWFCLGDIIDFIRPQKNDETLDWFRTQDIPTIKGNHEVAACAQCKVAGHHKEWIIGQPFVFRLVLPDHKSLLLYHNKPNDLWVHIDHITERELDEWFPIASDIKAILIGHNHKQFHFIPCSPDIDTELWSIGSLGINEQYVIMDEEYNFKFLKL